MLPNEHSLEAGLMLARDLFERIGAHSFDGKGFTRAAYGAVFGDIFMRCVYRMRPYEKVKGSTNALHEKWKKKWKKACKYSPEQY